MKRSKLVLSAKWCSFIHCPWKAFQKTPTPMLVLRWMPSKVREPRQPSLEGLNDHRQHHSCRATAERWTPDRRGWVRENRADTQGSDSFPGRDRNEWTTRPPHRRRTNPGAHVTAGLCLQVMLGRQPLFISAKSSDRGQKAVLGSEQFLKTTQEFPQKATHHLVGTKNTSAEHRVGVRCQPEKEARVYLVRCWGSMFLTSPHQRLFCRGRNQKRAGSSRC